MICAAKYEMGGAYRIHGRDQKCIQNVDRSLEGKRTLGRPRRRWEGNIRMNLRKLVLEGVNWMHFAQSRDKWQDLVKTAMNIRFPYKAENFLTS